MNTAYVKNGIIIVLSFMLVILAGMFLWEHFELEDSRSFAKNRAYVLFNKKRVSLSPELSSKAIYQVVKTTVYHVSQQIPFQVAKNILGEDPILYDTKSGTTYQNLKGDYITFTGLFVKYYTQKYKNVEITAEDIVKDFFKSARISEYKIISTVRSGKDINIMVTRTSGEMDFSDLYLSFSILQDKSILCDGKWVFSNIEIAGESEMDSPLGALVSFAIKRGQNEPSVMVRKLETNYIFNQDTFGNLKAKVAYKLFLDNGEIAIIEDKKT